MLNRDVVMIDISPTDGDVFGTGRALGRIHGDHVESLQELFLLTAYKTL